MSRDKTASGQQYGALCWRLHSDSVQVLLITSRDTGRWVIPKGWPMSGKTPWEAAEIEAWEEAGVTGQIDQSELGTVSYLKKKTFRGDIPVRMHVFALEVEDLCDSFPEKHQRKRKWMSVDQAASCVREPELQDIILSVEELVLREELPHL
jgi:8-oxo-dGTP pyrophosphatase MutT (NUDIX family)